MLIVIITGFYAYIRTQEIPFLKSVLAGINFDILALSHYQDYLPGTVSDLPEVELSLTSILIENIDNSLVPIYQDLSYHYGKFSYCSLTKMKHFIIY